MAAVYTTLAKVKILLRSGDAQKKIKFSENIARLRVDSSNTGTALLVSSGISISDTYGGHETFEIEFTTVTDYTVTKKNNELQEELLLATGSVSSDLVIADILTLASAGWSGTAVAGDKIAFDTTSDISNDDGTSFIEDTQDFIDGILEQNGYMAFRATDDATNIWDDFADVPKQVRYAATRLASYFLYSSIMKVEKQVSEDDESPKEVWGWFKEAVSMLKAYLDKVQVSKVISAPLWAGERPLIQGKGINDVGIGIVIPTDNLVLTRTDMDISGLLDWDEINDESVTLTE